MSSPCDQVVVIGKGTYGEVVVDASRPGTITKTTDLTDLDIMHACREAVVYSYLERVGLQGCVSPKRVDQRVDPNLESLQLVLERGRSIDPRVLAPATRLQFASQIVRLYAAWSAAGLYHFDLKLDNFVVMPGNLVRVIDWGLLRTDCDRLSPLNGAMAHAEFHRHPALLTRPTRVWGAEPYDCYEVWALCCTLRQLLRDTPAPPFVEAVLEHKTITTRSQFLRAAKQAGMLPSATTGHKDADADEDGYPEPPAVNWRALVPSGVDPRRGVEPSERALAFLLADKLLDCLNCSDVTGALVAVLDLWFTVVPSRVQVQDLPQTVACAAFLCLALGSEDQGEPKEFVHLIPFLVSEAPAAAAFRSCGGGVVTKPTIPAFMTLAARMFVAIDQHGCWLALLNGNPFARVLQDRYGFLRHCYKSLRALGSTYLHCAARVDGDGAAHEVTVADLEAAHVDNLARRKDEYAARVQCIWANRLAPCDARPPASGSGTYTDTGTDADTDLDSDSDSDTHTSHSDAEDGTSTATATLDECETPVTSTMYVSSDGDDVDDEYDDDDQ